MGVRKLIFSCVIFVLAGFICGLAAQEYVWWTKKHNWDGVTSWRRYMLISPGYMGPNALPVPEVKQGNQESSMSFTSSLVSYWSEGDKTQNPEFKLYTPLFNDRVALQIWLVPIEFYKMDTITRDARIVRDRDAEGYALGDFYISTYIQLLKDRKYWPDLLLGINLKTASGNNVGSARFTDTPGYFFDLSAGKTKYIGTQLKSIRFYLMAGLYVYQTYSDEDLQNDAFLYGGGLSCNFKRLEWNMDLAGYSGYLNLKDKPIVLRSKLRMRGKYKTDFELSYQYGLRDWLYKGLKFSWVYKL